MAANWKVTPGIQLIQDNEAIVGIKFTEKNALKELVNVLLSENHPEDLPPIGTWNVSDIIDMKGLFRDKIKTPEDNKKLDGIGAWVPKEVETMSEMFWYCDSFNQDISGWNVSKVKRMHAMFSRCISFNQDLSNWKLHALETMSYMFFKCKTFNSGIFKLEKGNLVIKMEKVFCDCELFNQDISGWVVSKVDDMNGMFWGCTNFNQDISQWDVSKVENMKNMFSDCTNFNQDISKWDVGNVTQMDDIFYRCRIIWQFKPPKFYSDKDLNEIKQQLELEKKRIQELEGQQELERQQNLARQQKLEWQRKLERHLEHQLELGRQRDLERQIQAWIGVTENEQRHSAREDDERLNKQNILTILGNSNRNKKGLTKRIGKIIIPKKMPNKTKRFRMTQLITDKDQNEKEKESLEERELSEPSEEQQRKKEEEKREEQELKKMYGEEVTQSIESIKKNLENIEEEHLSYYPTGTDTPQLKLHFNYLSLCINTIQQYIEYLKKQLISKITGGGFFDWFTGRRPVIQNNKANTVKTQRIDPASLNRIRPNRCLTEDQYNVIHKCDTNRWYRWRYSGDCRRYKGAADDITIRCEVLNNKQFNTIKDKLLELLNSKLCPFVQNNFQSEEASGICKRLRENLLRAQPSQTDYKSQIEDLTQINELIQPADKEQIPNNVTGTDTGTGTAKGTRRKRKTKRTKRTTRRKRKHGR
jgi:surface protein